MTDGPENKARPSSASSAGPVEDLAGKAMSVLLNQRTSGRRLLSDRFLERMERAATSVERDALRYVVADMLNAGISNESICESYIPVVARRLGAQWCEDTLGFSDVTIGASRLQLALRELTSERREPPHDAPAVAIVVPAEEDHTLGAVVLSGMLMRRGIAVRLVLGKSRSEIRRILEREPFEAVLISAAHTEKLARIKSLVTVVRAAVERKTPVGVGGAVLDALEDVKRQTGADFASNEVEDVVRLCGLKTRHSEKAGRS